MMKGTFSLMRAIIRTTLLLALLATTVMTGITTGTAAAATPGYRSITVTGDGQGYAAINGLGQVYAFGSVRYHGNPTGFTGDMVGISATRDGSGYAAVSTAGQVYAYGSVQHRGNPTGHSGIVGIAVTADGQGYIAISGSGQVYAYGTVAHRGNPSGFTGGIVAVSVTADGQGYAAISGSGQVYAYGTAQHRGNPTGHSGIVGISLTADGQGYVAVSNSGQVYAYGTTISRGNPSGFTGGIAAVATTADGAGYAALSGIGQVYAYGTVVHRGNADPNAGTASGVGTRIASIARTQAGDGSRNREVGGANCNYYTAQVQSSAAACGSQGWRAQAWCADFARWVWGQAGARTAGLTAGAISFRTGYGNYRSGADLYGVQPGDALVFNQGTSTTEDDHVGIVTAVGSSTVTMISGNMSDSVRSDTVYRDGRTQFTNKVLSGYTRPVT